MLTTETKCRIAVSGLKHRGRIGTTTPLKYGRVDSADVHPDYSPSGIAPRLGAALQTLASDDTAASYVPPLAEGILRTGDHSLLAVLADALDETEHPLATAFDYRHAPRAMEIDRALQQELGRRSSFGWDEHHGRHGLRPLPASEVRWRWYNRERGGGQRLSRTAALTAVRKAISDANPADVVHSLLRLADNENINRSERSWQRLSKVDVGVEPPGWFRGGAHTTASALLFPKQQVDWTNNRIEPHKYPDTRSQKKRKLSRLGLRLKYALERTQPLRKPQPELDLADTNPDIRTPQQIAEQNPPLQKPDFKRLDATDPSVKGFATVLKERAARHEENGTHQLHEELVARMQPPRGSPYSTTVAQSHLTGDQFVVVGLHDPKGNLVRHGVFGWEEIKKLAKTEPWLRTRLKGLALTGKAGVSKYARMGPDHADFHAQIHANRSEQTPPLVYADWLEDNDHPEAADIVRRHVADHTGSDGEDAGGYPIRDLNWTWLATKRNPLAVATHRYHDGHTLVRLAIDPHGDQSGLWWAAHYRDPEEADRVVSGLFDKGAVAEWDSHHKPTPVTPHEIDHNKPQRYAAYKAPAGGMVVRGVYYKGGAIVPGSEFWSRSAKFKRLKKRVKRRKGKQIKSNASTGQPLVVDFTSPA